MLFQENFIREVIDKADIVKVIQTYIDVIKQGSSYVAVCPFHNDTRPSMNISPQKKIFKCFSCGHGGNVITFVRDIEKISFAKAVERVCQICNIPLPSNYQSSYEKKVSDPNQKLFDCLQKASDFYLYQLKTQEGDLARSYVSKRGLNDSILSHFKIGYAPSDPNKIITLLKNKYNFSDEDIISAGIGVKNNNDVLIDRLRDRIIFPITDAFGRIVAFSGRIFKEGSISNSKYMNSPEGKIFNKSSVLYHFYEANEVARENKCIYIVEGFMDVIALYRANVKNAVALMGTALTKNHINMLKRLNVEVRLFLDNDNAGINAMANIVDTLINNNINVNIVEPFTDTKDCDEYLSKYGEASLYKHIQNVSNVLIFKLNIIQRSSSMTIQEDIRNFINENVKTYYKFDEFNKTLVRKKINEIFPKLDDSNIQTLFESAFSKENKKHVEENVEQVKFPPSHLISTANVKVSMTQMFHMYIYNELDKLVDPVKELEFSQSMRGVARKKSELIQIGYREIILLSYVPFNRYTYKYLTRLNGFTFYLFNVLMNYFKNEASKVKIEDKSLFESDPLIFSKLISNIDNTIEEYENNKDDYPLTKTEKCLIQNKELIDMFLTFLADYSQHFVIDEPLFVEDLENLIELKTEINLIELNADDILAYKRAKLKK